MSNINNQLNLPYSLRLSRGDFEKMFYYVKNLQGDIVKILDKDGISYASYVYDSWGNILE